MTDTDRAIKHFNRTIAQLKYLDGVTVNPYLKGYIKANRAKMKRRLQASRTALSALREKQERENPKTIYEKMCIDKAFAAWIISSALHNADYEDGDYDPHIMDLLEAPMNICGRKLVEG